MRIEIDIAGTDPEAAAPEAEALLALLATGAPARRRVAPGDDDPTRSWFGTLSTAITILVFVIELPSLPEKLRAWRETLDRLALSERVRALRDRLQALGADGRLDIEGVGSVDLRRTSTDEVVDLLLRDRGGGDRAGFD